MKRDELKGLLENIRNSRIGIVGDFCLDAYVLLEPAASEVSIETGLATRPVRSQRYMLGGAGNVAKNLKAMGVEQVSVFGVVGRDPFGEEMRRLCISAGITTDGLLMQGEQWDTHVYMKPVEHEHEQHRLDFGNFNQLHPLVCRDLIETLSADLPRLDIVIINQQIARGIHTKEFRESLRALIVRNPGTMFIADSRHYIDEYTGTMRKLNLREGTRLFESEGTVPDLMDGGEVEGLCRGLYRRWGKTVFLTRGERGCAVFDREGFHEIPGLLILAPVDPVGAGDSMLAGITAALAAGAGPHTAAELGSLVAGVTVQKLMQTGTASPQEILNLGTDPDFRYRPDLARQSHKAVFQTGTDIEIVSALPSRRGFTHAIFDHDGTLSTLRQGWEEIMEPMMIRAILGKNITDADEALYDHVRTAVREYIDNTTGIQTLVQMKGLVNLVRQFRSVPEEDILDEFGYKKMYNDQLLGMVNDRVAKLAKGELDVMDFTIKGAVDFLTALHRRGVRLYLASGTDQEDVERECEILGYRSLFENRIYGAVGDATKEAKRMVLERILGDIGDRGPGEILTIGDGPVEIRETHKRGGYTIGVASNEIRRYGIVLSKRRRLIEAGADLIIPDFCQRISLLPLLFDA
jgi:bifunctional ADP-heptose synthase (sugar kinase/adenylyltransferase)/phosphoglycolate phosphatase-like HAD superfamily hydrolase